MFIKTKLPEEDFINATFVVSFSKPSMKIFIGIMFLGSVFAIVNTIFIPDTTYQTFIVPLGASNSSKYKTVVGVGCRAGKVNWQSLCL